MVNILDLVKKIEKMNMQDGHGQDAINNLISMHDLQQLSPASTTAVNISVPSGEDFSENRAQNLANKVGSIGPTPFIQTKEGMKTILDMVTGSPGSAIGRVSKASITGGQAAKSTLQQLSEMGNRFGIKEHPSKWEWSKEMIDNFVLGTKNRNKINAARLRMEKAYDKHGLPHEIEATGPWTTLLNLLNRN